jgi:FkbM family methyltransferase
MSLAARVLRHIGATTLGLPLMHLAGRLGQWELLPTTVASRAVEELASSAHARTLVAPVDLYGQPGRLELDLSMPSSRSLLVQPLRLASESVSMRLFCALIRDAKTILDVGANVGIYTYLAASRMPFTRILSYEPTPALAALITRNLERNGWAHAEVRCAGVSAAESSMTFYVRGNDVESTFEPALVTSWPDVQQQIDVPVVALDDIFDREQIVAARAVLKIDVEGHEMRVLDGFERTLRRSGRRPTLLMEFLGRAINDACVIDRVRSYGLDVYYVTPRALVKIDATPDLGPVHEMGQHNFLITDKPPSEVALWAARSHISSPSENVATR